jgi:two-component system, NarL family, sensor kinase
MYSQEITLLLSIILASALVAGIVILFITSFILQQKRMIRLQEQLIHAEIETLEKERKRIAEDLHDDLGPLLSTVKIRLNSMELESDEDKYILKQSSQILDEAVKELRHISHNLMPSSLHNKGLEHAVQDVVNKLQEAKSTQVVFNPPSTPLPLDKQKEVTLYRIIQEALNNALKHAAAEKIEISLQKEGKWVKLQVQDNGNGFDYQARIKDSKSGLGLKNIASRVNLLQGKFQYQSAVGKGTKLTIEFPV